MEKMIELLQFDNQAAWIMLSTSLSKQPDYLLTLQYPSDIGEMASSLDSHIWETLERISGQHIPRKEEGLGIECFVDVPGVPCLFPKPDSQTTCEVRWDWFM